MSPCSKAEDAEVSCPQAMVPVVDTLTQEAWSLHMVTGFLMSLLVFPLGPYPIA